MLLVLQALAAGAAAGQAASMVLLVVLLLLGVEGCMGPPGVVLLAAGGRHLR